MQEKEALETRSVLLEKTVCGVETRQALVGGDPSEVAE